MPNPTISTTLVERASAPQNSDVPRGSIVVVVGPAESGPTTPQRVDNAGDAYARYGDGVLARSVELAHLGVRHIDMPTSPLRVWTAINAAMQSVSDARTDPAEGARA